MKRTIYLDHAATTFPKPECVYQTMDEINRSLAVNAGRGSYALAREAVNVMDKVRMELAEIAHAAQVAEVVLTPSATCALNEIIGGIKIRQTDTVYVSPFEHNAVIRPLHLKQDKIGFTIEELPCRETSAEIDIEKMKYMFAQNPPAYVFMSHVSNVTGYILPVEMISDEAKKYQAEIIVDASQSMGLIPIDFAAWDLDYLVFAGHKTIYGAFGTGGFLIRHGRRLEPYFAGGTGSDSLNPRMPIQAPMAYEAGSPNIVSAGGLLAAMEDLKAHGNGTYEDGIHFFYEKEKMLTERLITGLQKIKDVQLYLPPADAHIGIVAFNLKGYQAADIGMILDEDYQIAVRTGYHCAPLIHKVLGDESYAGVVRASVGRFTTEEEIESFVDAVEEILEG